MKKKSTWKRFIIIFAILVLFGNALPDPEDIDIKWPESESSVISLKKHNSEGIFIEECSDASTSGCVRKVYVNGIEYSHFVQGMGEFSQHEFLWNSQIKTVRRAGCGFTSCASLASGYKSSVTPERAFSIMDDKFRSNYDIEICLKRLGIIGKWYPDPKGKSAKECSKYFYELAREALQSGKPVIVLMGKDRAIANGVSDPTFWTSGAHFVAIVAMDEENIYTLDSRNNTKGYIYSEGLEEASLFMKGIWIPDESPSAISVSEETMEVEEKGENNVSQELGKSIDALSSLKSFFNSQAEENTEKKGEIKDKTSEEETRHEIFLPPKEDTGFKTFMSWKYITDKSSLQYKLQHDGHAWTDEYGLRRYDNHYMIALGSYYAPEVGRIFRIVLEDGTEFTAIVGDQKADKDTDKYNRYRKVGDNVNVVEFIVETSKLPKEVRRSGNISTLSMKDGKSFKSKVMYMELLYSPY